MRRTWGLWWLAGIATGGLAYGCSDGGIAVVSVPSTGGFAGQTSGGGGDAGANSTGGSSNQLDGLGVGEDCSDADCRTGLVCSEEDVCEPAGSTAPGNPCVIASECAGDAQCVTGICVPAGSGEVGDACTTDASCGVGLRCGIKGLSAECIPAGDGDVGASCAASGDCFAGLFCTAGECSLPASPLGPALYAGVDCEEPDESGDVKAYFEIPGSTDANEGDFFRLPFPNDILIADGHPQLDGFPTPGPDLLGVDLVKTYVDVVEAGTSGWSANGSIIFRFSGEIDFDTLRFEEGKRPVVLVDLTAGDSSEPGDATRRLGLRWVGGSSRTKYVCDNWVAARPGFAQPLEPGHTYAVWITDDARAAGGGMIERSENFDAMLAESAPAEGALADAYAAYAPLRDYLTSASIDPDTLVNGTVFTVDDPLAPMRKLAEAVATSDVPTSSDWVKCADGVDSPCPQAGGNRACGEGTADYDEYHALIELPIFQEGDAPYETTGGGISESVERTEQVCLSLTVPKDTMPGAGWPLVIYAHGTGGTFRNHVRDEVAGVLSRATPKFAVLGIDQVQHGPRRGESTEDPDVLFFNFLNPDAARGNPLQGAADQISLYRFASSLDLTAEESGGDAIQIDGTKIVFFGHSQGATHGSLMLPFSSYPGAVLSGNGGSFVHALLNKTNPVNIAGAIPFAIQDINPSNGQLQMEDTHPVLTLLQHWIDPADPLHFGRVATVSPEMGQPLKSIFQTFGLDDTYSPPATLSAFALASKLDLAPHPSGVNPMDENDIGIPEEAMSVSDNLSDGMTTATGVVRQYEGPSDGHFVVFDVEEANDDMVTFLEALAEGSTPAIP